MTATALKLSDVFDRAADVVARNGHHKDGWWDDIPNVPDDQCPVCAGGAVNIVIDGSPDVRPDQAHMPGLWWDAYETLAAGTGLAMPLDLANCDANEVFDAYIGVIGRWNDAPERTAEEVISKLRAIADDLRGEGR